MSPESDSGGNVTSSSTSTSTVTTNTQGTSMNNPPTCLVRMPSSPGPAGPSIATTEGFFSSTSIDSETQLASGSGGDSSRRNRLDIWLKYKIIVSRSLKWTICFIVFSLKPNVSTDSGTSVGGTSINFPGSTTNQQLSPTGYRRTGLRRQSTAYEEGLPIKSGTWIFSRHDESDNDSSICHRLLTGHSFWSVCLTFVTSGPRKRSCLMTTFTTPSIH